MCRTKDEMVIDEGTFIEELVERRPGAVKYLLGKGIRCVRCGEPVWGSLGRLLDDHGMKGKERKRLLKDLNEL